MLYTYLIIPEHEDILVSQEHLEGVDPLLSDQHSHLLLHLLAPPSHSDMEGVVTTDLGVRPTTPSVVHLQQALILGTKNKINCTEKRILILEGTMALYIALTLRSYTTIEILS